jgi:hypothetical protein
MNRTSETCEPHHDANTCLREYPRAKETSRRTTYEEMMAEIIAIH